MSTETLNWQDFISDWRFVCGGESPPEGLDASVVPAVTRTISGAYEITTISFGFSGTAPYYQQKFTAIFSGMSGTDHEPGTQLMALGKENDWEDTVGFGIFKFPYGFFNSRDFLDAEEDAVLGTLTWKIPVRWTVASEEELVEIEKTVNDERDYKKEISPKSVQIATCKKIKLVNIDSDGALWSGTGLSISVKKDFCPEQAP